jgi:hypothetical protein
VTPFEALALPELASGVSFERLCAVAEARGDEPAALTRALLGWLGEELLTGDGEP